MTRTLRLTVAIACTLPLCAAQAQGVDTLTYSSVPAGVLSSHYVPAACWADVMQAQAAFRGQDPGPLSPQYLMNVIGKSDGLFGQINRIHGFSSPRLGWQFAHDVGTCPIAFCQAYDLRITDAATTAAVPYRVGELIGMDALPTYADSIAYIAAHPGAALILATDSYESYAVVGVDAQGRGVWLDHNGRTGPPLVRYLTVAEGTEIWERMANVPGHAPAEFVLVVNPRN